MAAIVRFVIPVVNGTTAVPAAAEAKRTGYWMLGSNGQVFAFGDAQRHGDQAGGVPSVDLEPTPSGAGYWILGDAGAIDAFGDAQGRLVIDRLPPLDRDEEARACRPPPRATACGCSLPRGG